MGVATLQSESQNSKSPRFKRLWIFEKPSMARECASYLGKVIERDGYMVVGDDAVTSVFGHMLRIGNPEEQNENWKYWNYDNLPLVPERWKFLPRGKEVMPRLDLISSLIKDSASIVHGGDAGREGQMLIDEILIYFQNRKPVDRIWLDGLDREYFQKALAEMQSNALPKYANLSKAAFLRAKIDWIFGMSLTPAFSLAAKRCGYRGVVFSYGRVQIPTLKLIVDRENEIRSFHSVGPLTHYGIKVRIRHPHGSFFAKWKIPSEGVGIDSEGRLFKKDLAEKIRQSLDSEEGRITAFSSSVKKQAPPLPLDLSELTLIASRKFKYTAQQVLDIAQQLYEDKKLITYPRSESRYLRDTQRNDAPAVLRAIIGNYPDLRGLIIKSDPKIESAAFNSAKVLEHFAIIPSTYQRSITTLSVAERNIYDLIVRSYVAIFHPDYSYKSTTAEILSNGFTLISRGTEVVARGWKDVIYGTETEQINDEESETRQIIPIMKKGESVLVDQSSIIEMATKPPPRFNDGTLGVAMKDVHKYVSDNVEAKKILKETNGIGTQATRAGIFTKLEERSYAKRDKNMQWFAEPLGEAMISVLPAVAKSPELTASLEDKLNDVAKGEYPPEKFYEASIAWCAKLVLKSKTIDFPPQAAEQLKKKVPTSGPGPQLTSSKGKSTKTTLKSKSKKTAA